MDGTPIKRSLIASSSIQKEIGLKAWKSQRLFMWNVRIPFAQW